MTISALAIGSGSGDVGQAISFILHADDFPFEVVPFDQKPRTNTRFNRVYKSPSFGLPIYKDWLKTFFVTKGISHYVPCSEYEMRFLPNYLHLIPNVQVFWVGTRIFELFDDKLVGGEFLKRNGFDVPLQYGSEILECQFSSPLVVKPRRSSGSRGVHVCRSQSELATALSNTENPLIQQYIPYLENEFTVGVYRNFSGDTRTIILLRELQDGRTKSASVVADEQMALECARLAAAIELDGSINIQIRKFNGINYIFEVNPRFSSTLQGRHLLGFSDFMWALGLEEIPDQREIDLNIGKKIIRGKSGEFHLDVSI